MNLYDPIRLPYASFDVIQKMRPVFQYERIGNQLYISQNESIAILLNACFSFHVDSYGDLYILNKNWTFTPIYNNSFSLNTLIDIVSYEYKVQYKVDIDYQLIYNYLLTIPDVSHSKFIHPLCVNFSGSSDDFSFNVFSEFFTYFLGDTDVDYSSSFFLSQCLRTIDELIHYDSSNKTMTFVFTGDHNLQGLLWLLDVFKNYNIPVYTVYDKDNYLKCLYQDDNALFKIIHIPFMTKDEVDEWYNYPLVFDFSYSSYNGDFKVTSYKEAESIVFYYFYHLSYVINDCSWTYDEKNNYLYLRYDMFLIPLPQFPEWLSNIFQYKLYNGPMKALSLKNEKIWCVSRVVKNEDGSYGKEPVSVKTGKLLSGTYDTFNRLSLLATYDEVTDYINDHSNDEFEYLYAINLNKSTPIVVLDIDNGHLSQPDYPIDLVNSKSVSGKGQHFYSLLYDLDNEFELRPFMVKNITQSFDESTYELFTKKKVITLSDPDVIFKMRYNRIYWFDYIYRYMIQKKYIEMSSKFKLETPNWNRRSASSSIERYACEKGLSFANGSRHNDAMVLFGYAKTRGISYDVLIDWILENVPDWEDAKKELEASKRSFLNNNI